MIFESDADIPAIVEQFSERYFSVWNVRIPFYIEQIGDSYYRISEDRKEAYLISQDDNIVRITDANFELVIDITAQNRAEAEKVAQALVKLMNMKCVRWECVD